MKTRLLTLTLTVLVFCLFPLAAQHSFYISGGFAEGISNRSTTGRAIQLEYDRTFSMKENLDFVVGLGLKQMEYTKTTGNQILGRVISEPPIPHHSEDTYLIRQSNLQLRLGVQRRFGRINLGGYLLPGYRINSQLDYDFTYYSIRDIAVGTFNLAPIDFVRGRPNSYIGPYHQYDSRFSAEVSLVANVEVGKRWTLGLEYQQMVIGNTLIYSSEFDCPLDVACILVGTFRKEVPAKVGTVLLRAGLRF